MEISSWIADGAARSPDKPALRFDDEEIAYGALELRVARLAGALAEREEIAEGDRVAYLGQNAPELLDLLFACARLGAILVPLSARMPAPELAVVLGNTEPTALLAEAELAKTAAEAGSGCPAGSRVSRVRRPPGAPRWSPGAAIRCRSPARGAAADHQHVGHDGAAAGRGPVSRVPALQRAERRRRPRHGAQPTRSWPTGRCSTRVR